jgi:hypothetical protein
LVNSPAASNTTVAAFHNSCHLVSQQLSSSFTTAVILFHNNCHLLSQQLVILFHNNCHLERSTIVGEANNCVESKDPYSSISVEVASGSSPQNLDAFPVSIPT